MPMHQDFADWYRRVHIEPKEEDLGKRWEAIEAFHEKAKPSDLCDATRVFFGLPPKSEDFLQKYRDVFKATDSAFPMRDNDAEIRVLAGATLANHFTESDKWASLAALALVCGSCEGNRKAPVPEIVELARRDLRKRSSCLRAAKKKTALPASDLSDKVANLKTTIANAGANTQAIQGPLMDVLQPLIKGVASVAAWAREVERMEELHREESDILWWLFGEYSRDLNVPFSELKAPSGCLIGAKEIADLTRVLPGPFGTEAYLHKMLSLAHPELTSTVLLSDAVLGCSVEWQKQFAALAGLDYAADLCPAHLAAQKSVEAGGKKTAWHAPFQTASGLKATMKMKPLDMALQAYRERLLMVVIELLQESSDD
jgi:hypothetical protein